jgi:hypothetical protein
MKYFRLFELQNQYPTIRNYTRENSISSVNSLYNHGDAVLTGIFPENQRRFPLSNVAFIRPIANTSIRFILRVKKSADDEFPRYFTSFNYFAELEQSITTPNPYFLNLSLLDTNIVEFDLSDSIRNFIYQIETESSRNVKMFKNNFLKIIDTTSKDNKTTTYGSDPNGVVKDTTEISGEIIPIEQTPAPITTEITNDVERRGLFGLRRRNVDEITNDDEPRGIFRRRNVDETNPRMLAIENANIRVDSNVEQTQNETTLIEPEKVVAKRIFKTSEEPSISDTETKPKSDVEKMVEQVIENPYLDLVDEENQIYVDYRDLCYYLSWCLSSPTLDSVENNGVLTANELSKFEFTNKTNNTDKQDNPPQNTGDVVPLETTGRFFEYDIIRLTIPATLEQSKMKFRNQAGEMQEIQTDQYGLVGRFCCEENSWAENHYVYQKTQIGPCGQNNSAGGGFGGAYNGYGYSKDYDARVGAGDFINQERDYRNIQQ